MESQSNWGEARKGVTELSTIKTYRDAMEIAFDFASHSEAERVEDETDLMYQERQDIEDAVLWEETEAMLSSIS